MNFWSFLNENNGALMAIITAVYVIATILIFWANNKSAKATERQLEATKNQLEESKRQYEDKKRLEIMPYIQFEESSGLGEHILHLALDSSNKYSEHYDLVLKIKNIGNGTAKDIAYTYEWDDSEEKYDHGAFPVQALSAEESQRVKIEFASASDGKDKTAILVFRYNDLLDHPYTQQLSIRFKRGNQSLLELDELLTSSPELFDKENNYA